MRSRIPAGASVALLVVSFFFPEIATTQITELKLTAFDGETCDYFGWSQSLSEDYLLVGSIRDIFNGREAGAAYFFRPNASGWVIDSKVVPSSRTAFEKFGWSVSVSGNHALIGAIGSDYAANKAGCAYSFQFDGAHWVEQARITARDAAAEDYFGYDVSISGEYALIGAMLDDDLGTDAGSVYLFKYEGSAWVQRAKLLASDGAPGDCFGTTVFLSGNYAIIGAFGDDNQTGSIYVFHNDGSNWMEQAKLTASDAAPDSHFGRSIFYDRNYVIVGAPYHDDEGQDDGAAYIFHHDGSRWVEEAKLLSSDRAFMDHFGRSVSILGDYVLVGTSRDDDDGDDSGSAYIFHYDGTTWVEQTKITPSDGAARDHFGRLVWLSDEYAIIASTFDDHNGMMDVGSIYCYGNYTWRPPVSVTLTVSSTVGDGTFDCIVDLTSNADSSQVVDYWTEAIGPNGTRRVIQLVEGKTLPGGKSISDTTEIQLRANTPPGEYTLVTYAGAYPGGSIDSSSVVYTKISLEKGVLSDSKRISDAFLLHGNYPNPFNPSTTIRYGLPEKTHVKLEVFNILGQRVALLVDGEMEAGYHEARFDASELAGGLYLYRISAGGVTESKTLMLLK